MSIYYKFSTYCTDEKNEIGQFWRRCGQKFAGTLFWATLYDIVSRQR